MNANPQKIIIIGATSGIGKELALLYLQNGYRVGITGRRQELLHQLENQFPQQIVTSSFDVTGGGNIQHLETLVAKMGGMDIFIYNSGFGDVSESLDPVIENATIKTNVNGFAEMTAWAFNWLCKQGSGQIAATSSVAANRGSSRAPSYSASKSFMSNYMEGLHLKNKRLKKSIAVTDIQPGFVRTKMAKGHGQFWVASPEKAAQQIFNAIQNKKRKVYITHRWRLIAWLMRNMPYIIYSKIG
jgi:short-subunit dehydrogenase